MIPPPANADVVLVATLDDPGDSLLENEIHACVNVF